jgi:hypothetical protein
MASTSFQWGIEKLEKKNKTPLVTNRPTLAAMCRINKKKMS